jgi:hypothetical protein
MTAPVTLLNPTRGPTRRPLSNVEILDPDEAYDRKVRRTVGFSWALLLLNTLTFYPKTWSGQPLFIPIPSIVGKAVTQGALPLALLAALSVNRRIAIRPNIFLCLASLLAIEAAMNCVEATHLGTYYRTIRLATFLITLWVLTPYWGRRDLLLVRCHLRAAYVVLASILLGLIVAHHTAMAQGRLAGAIWPTPPTQVAEFAAVTTGIVVVLWMGGQMSGRFVLPVSAVSITILLLTHTRTALVAMIGGIVVGGLSLYASRARVRKIFAIGSVAASVGGIAASGFLTTWLVRGENTQELTKLTGRTLVWSAVDNIPRTKFQDLFGFGLSNKSFNGLPIDSNWLASYLDQGLFGVGVCAVILVFLLVTAFFQPRGIQRALALFLVTYCLAASFTETGFSDASTYLLYLALAASMLVPRMAAAR